MALIVCPRIIENAAFFLHGEGTNDLAAVVTDMTSSFGVDLSCASVVREVATVRVYVW